MLTSSPRGGWIDPVSNLARQKVSIFHGYNDGIVKKPVSEALYTFYSHYAGPQVFYKNNLPAGHAQIIDRCPIAGGQGGALQDCACRRTGDEFIKNCNYDAAGVLLQHIYGNLAQRVAAPTGELKSFSQRPFTAEPTGQKTPMLISMGDKGYVYVPASCSAMKPCRVHVALHGCQQYADNPVIGDRFARYGGYNEWADANNLIVLYPQATANATVGNPEGCWDWWGYAHQTDSQGKYATKAGLQVAAIWRMLERLTSGYTGWQSTAARGPLAVTDVSDSQVALRWGTVTKAVGYNVYRADSTAGPYLRINTNGPSPPMCLSTGRRRLARLISTCSRA